MLRSQVLLVALLSSVLLGQVSGAPRRDMLTLRADLSSDKVSDEDLNGWKSGVNSFHGEQL